MEDFFNHLVDDRQVREPVEQGYHGLDPFRFLDGFTDLARTQLQSHAEYLDELRVVDRKGCCISNQLSHLWDELDYQFDEWLRLQSLLVALVEFLVLWVFSVEGGEAVVSHEPAEGVGGGEGSRAPVHDDFQNQGYIFLTSHYLEHGLPICDEIVLFYHLG